uniref:ORF63 n=1 Tax=Pinus thunbergii TaxID=3350 RepID=Q32973_PINTH|nr:ORF63 [Pinus thunbergii]
MNKNPFPNCTSLSQGIQLSGCILYSHILNKYNRDEKEHLLYSLCPDSLHPRSLYSIIWLIFFM